MVFQKSGAGFGNYGRWHRRGRGRRAHRHRSLAKHATTDAMLATMAKSIASRSTGQREREDAEAIIARVSGTTHLTDLADCDCHRVVVEDLEVSARFSRTERGRARGRDHARTRRPLVIELAMETSRRSGLRAALLQSAPAMSLVEVVRPIAPVTKRWTALPSSYSRAAKNRQREGPGRLRRQRAPLPVSQQRIRCSSRAWRPRRASTSR